MWHAIAAGVVVLLLPIAGWAQNQEYELRVGRLVVSSTNWDFFSTADFQVQAQRRDPAVEERIGALDTRIGQFRNEAEHLTSRIRPLQQKEAQSKIEAGPPLTDTERELRALLSGITLAEASNAQRTELRRLNRKDEESRRSPGPPLTANEGAVLQSIADRLSAVQRDLRNTVSERSRTRALIYGQTRTLDSESRTLDFESQRVLTVYTGDDLLITVVDEDVSEDDVIGRHTLRITNQILVSGSVELGRAGSVRTLELHFAPIR